MPYDPHSFDEEEDDRPGAEGKRRRFDEFECPACNASNPYDESFGDGDEVLCHYCGQEYKAQVTEDGRLKLRES